MSQKPTSTTSIIAACSYGLISISITLFNKAVLSTYNFHLTLAMSFSQMVCSLLILVLFIALPLGWVQSAPIDDLQWLVRHPLTRLGLIVFVMLCLFHWAHRFRYTLYDGLQLSHLNEVIAVLMYGMAMVGTVVGAYLIWGVG